MKGLSDAALMWLIVMLNRLAAQLGGIAHHLSFVHFKNFVFAPQRSDIFVCRPFPFRDNLMQMIVYQLLTDDAELPFTHISEVMPWFERKLGVTTRFAASSWRRGQYRIFKSHLSYRRSPTIPKGPGRYIYVTRDGRDVAMSYYKFHQSHMNFEGSFEEFFQIFMRGHVQFEVLVRARGGLAIRTRATGCAVRLL